MGLLKNIAEKGMDTWEDKKDDIINDLFDEESKENMVNALNEAVDIPFISEKTEGKAIASMLNIVEDVVKALLLKKL
tara:strand:- start:1998 stop:2228 length:231 start_codon:yes stop_codon:yes gene_type:complete